MQDLEQTRQSLEEITKKTRSILSSLLPIERKNREAASDFKISTPKSIFLGRLYEEVLMIQRISALKTANKDGDDPILTKMQGKAIFPFALALYLPLKRKDFPFSYDDFYRTPVDGYDLHGEYSLDLLLEAQKPSTKKSISSYEKQKFSNSSYVLTVNGENLNPDILKALHYFHNLEVSHFIMAYVTLLRDIKEKLRPFAEVNIQELKERDIPPDLPNLQIKIFPEGNLEAHGLEEERNIIETMIKSDDWTQSLEAIGTFFEEVRDPRTRNLKKNRVLSTDGTFTPPKLAAAPEKKEIIGIDDNLNRLEALIRGYAKGKSTPNIVLLGAGGVGKTTSLQYVMESTKDLAALRYFLMSSLDDIQQLAKLSKDYKPVGIIDDMRGEVNPRVYAGLKQQLEGLSDRLFDRALIIISANPEIWNQLDDPVKQRLGGVELKYEPKPETYQTLVKQFCSKFGVKYRDGLVEEVKKMVPRQIRDHIRALGAEEAGKSRDYIKEIK